VSAFFVLTAPVEVSFDLTTMFIIPTTGQPVRLRASGSLQVRCSDPGLLIAQFVGLPFDRVNDGILRSVSRSVERMLARLLIRRVVLSGSPHAVLDQGMLPSIVEELIAYNPTAGAVFGVDLIRMGHLTIVADDGSSPYIALPQDWSEGPHAANGDLHRSYAAAAAAEIAQRVGDVSLVETARGRPGSVGDFPAAPRSIPQSSPEITPPPVAIAGEIRVRAQSPQEEPPRLPPPPRLFPSYEPHPVEMPPAPEDTTQPGVQTPVPGTINFATGTLPRPDAATRNAILGVGMSPIGHTGAVSGEIAPKVAPGARVLVPGPNGLMQSATVRQLLQGYYELEVGSSGETIWVPVSNVVPEY
jgi:hypothetical protein